MFSTKGMVPASLALFAISGCGPSEQTMFSDHSILLNGSHVNNQSFNVGPEGTALVIFERNPGYIGKVDGKTVILIVAYRKVGETDFRFTQIPTDNGKTYDFGVVDFGKGKLDLKPGNYEFDIIGTNPALTLNIHYAEGNFNVIGDGSSYPSFYGRSYTYDSHLRLEQFKSKVKPK